MPDRRLLKCPFCNGMPKLRRKNRTIINGETKRNCYVYCSTCDSRGTRFIYDDFATTEETHQKAIDAWNRRF